MSKLTAKYLHSIIQYDWETGDWFWLVDRGKKVVRAGDRAGGIDSKGYIQIRIDNHFYRAHRLAFLYITGRWPLAQVDHVNLVKHDNRWRNLREATNSENQGNRPQLTLKKSNLPRGVCINKAKNFRAKICETYLGTFKTVEQASAVYEAVARKHYGEFYHEP